MTQRRGLERWSGHDTTLERDVTLTLVDAEHPNRAGILDAARRAAGIEDTRLVRILDVGSQAANSYIVEEAMSGAESLAAILHQGALPAEEARRFAGEVASGLETARQRGLHHLRLTPHSILRTSDGAIKVSGVAVAAAIDETQEPDPAAASRRDAVSVVAVAYAALTSRWPLQEQVAGMEPAPRVVDGVAAPSEIAPARSGANHRAPAARPASNAPGQRSRCSPRERQGDRVHGRRQGGRRQGGGRRCRFGSRIGASGGRRNGGSRRGPGWLLRAGCSRQGGRGKIGPLRCGPAR